MERIYASTLTAFGITVAIVVSAVLADDAEKVFNDLFGDRIKQVTASVSRSDDIDLAKQILADVEKTKVESLIVLFCDNAYELAMRHPDGYAIAVDAMRTLAAKVPTQVEHADEKLLEVLNRQFRSSKGNERIAAGENLIDENLARARRLYVAGEIDHVIAALRKVVIIATQIRSVRKDEIKAGLNTLIQRQLDERKAAYFEEKLLKDSSDQASADSLAKLYLVQLNQPDKALALASRVKDQSLKQYFAIASKPAQDLTSGDRLTLAEHHLDFADGAPEAAQHRMLTLALELLNSVVMSKGANQIAATKAKLLAEGTQRKLGKLQGHTAFLLADSSPGVGPPIRRGTLPKPLAIYTFDKTSLFRRNSSLMMRDHSPKMHHGIVHGFELKEGIAAEAGYFEGDSDSLIVKSLIEPLSNNLKKLSIACWAKPKDTTSFTFLFSAGCNDDYAIMLGGRDGSWRGSVLRGVGFRSSTAKIESTNWVHLAVTWNSGTYVLYLNGVAGKTQRGAKDMVTRDRLRCPGNHDVNREWDIPRIGCQAKVLNRDKRSFRGLIDEMVIYPECLDANQVQILYDAGKAGVGLDKLH